MLRGMTAIVLAAGMAGCGLLSPPSGQPASRPPHAPSAMPAAAPLEAELPGHLQRGQTPDEIRRVVSDAYSHVPQEPILRIETQAHLRAIHALSLNPRSTSQRGHRA